MSDEEKVVETAEPGVVQPATAAPEPAKPEKAEPAEEPYAYDRCTIQIGIQLLPDDSDPAGRPVIVGVRDHANAPILKLMRRKDLGVLPSVVTDLLIELQEQLPARQKAHEEAEAKRKADEEAAQARREAAAAAAKVRAKKSKPQCAPKPAQFKPDYGEDETDEPETPETTPAPSVSLKGLMVEGQTSLFSIQEDEQ
jgi:hypothetical protein